MIDLNIITQAEIQNFIIDNTNTDLTQFLLKANPFPNLSIQEIAQQIKGRQIAQKKFPFLLKEGIVFPPHLNIEQASSQETAISKSSNLSGKTFLDLTCGFGIDAYFFAQNFEKIYLVEQNSTLSKIVKHNWKILGKSAYFINDNLENFLKENKEVFDLLEELSPNILEIQDKLSSFAKRIIIKLSPLIDIKYLQNSIKNIYEIEIIGVKNDVKEVILHIIPNFQGKIRITSKNLSSPNIDFSFFIDEESSAISEYSDVLEYIYIPNNAVLKSGAFNLISEKFKLKKLHPNTHIYTSNEKLKHFCGRIFRVKEISAKSLQKGIKFNIISKNHPLSPEEIKSKYKLKNGGDDFLFFTQSQKGKIILKSI